MKTTKLINGKTFDEIFGQRGKKTTVEKLVKGNLYLLDQTGRWSWNWLSVYDGERDPEKDEFVDIGFTRPLSSNGFDEKVSVVDNLAGFFLEEISAIYEATPDQIALHELYVDNNQ